MKKFLIIMGMIIVFFSTKLAIAMSDYMVDLTTLATAWDIRALGILCFVLGIIIKPKESEGENVQK